MGKRILGYLSSFFIICFLTLSLGGCGDSSSGSLGERQANGDLPKDKAEKQEEARVFTLSELGSGEEIDFPLDFQGEKLLLIFFSLG